MCEIAQNCPRNDPKSFAAGTPLRELTTLPKIPYSRLERGTSLRIPLDVFDRCSWTFVETGGDGDRQFLKRGCALGRQLVTAVAHGLRSGEG